MFTKTNKSGDTNSPARATQQDAIRGAASKPMARAAASIICNDMVINGSVISEGALQIDGVIDGDVSAGDVTVGSTGKITGEVKAEVVKVKGHITGSIRARKVELETGCRVQGDILHSSLQIQPNAVFEGQVKHSDDPLHDAEPKAAIAASEPVEAAVEETVEAAESQPVETQATAAGETASDVEANVTETVAEPAQDVSAETTTDAQPNESKLSSSAFGFPTSSASN